MAIVKLSPTSPGQRFVIKVVNKELHKGRPFPGLVIKKNKTGGRNNNGRITCRHIGGGHKQKYRIIDFKRKKRDIEAEVKAIEYDPNRTCRIVLLQYTDGEKTYILAPAGLNVGDKVIAGENAEPKVGNA